MDANDIDVIISTGPPHSVHLIAEILHQKNDIKWLADFRDPWSDLYYNKDFKQLAFAKNKNRKLEESVLKNADCITTLILHLPSISIMQHNYVFIIKNRSNL